MIQNPFSIDKIDKDIIMMLQTDPEIEVSEIAKKVRKSEAVVGNRILKLERNNLIHTQIGMNLKDINIPIAMVEIASKNSYQVLKRMKKCPIVFNAFKKTGEYDIMAMFIGQDVESLDSIINSCYQTDPNIKKIRTSYIFETLKDQVIPVNFDVEQISANGCPMQCMSKEYEMKKLKDLVKQTRSSSKISNLVPDEQVIEVH